MIWSENLNCLLIVEQGGINIEALMKSRAQFDRTKSFLLFGTEPQNKIFSIVRNINKNAQKVAKGKE